MKPLANPARSAMLLMASALLLSACSTWSRWEDSAHQQDPPYVQGARAVAKGRSTSCLMCSAGGRGEYAFFGNGRGGSGGPYRTDSAARDALDLVRRANALPWTAVGKDVTGREELFAPVRIIVISLDPLLVATVPWQYRTEIRNGAAFALGDEVRVFIANKDSETWIAHEWLPGLRNVIEVRGTLPAQATRVTLYASDSSASLALPEPGAAPVSANLGRQCITFTRAGTGPVEIAFAPARR